MTYSFDDLLVLRSMFMPVDNVFQNIFPVSESKLHP